MQMRLTSALLALCGGVVAAHTRAPANGTAAQGIASLAPDAADHEAGVLHSKVETALAGVYFMEREPSASGKAAGKAAPQAGPLQMQVPEKELKSLTGKLSATCKKQFMAILQGSGPALHTFGAPGTKTSAAGCRELEGSLCAMDARVTKQTDTHSRQMSSVTSVNGDGCVPHRCSDGTDLAVLVDFMQAKAKEAIPGTGTQVQLTVDCSKAGGSVAEAGSAASAPKVRGAGRNVKKGGASARGLLPALAVALAGLSFAL